MSVHVPAHCTDIIVHETYANSREFRGQRSDTLAQRGHGAVRPLGEMAPHWTAANYGATRLCQDCVS